MKFSAAELLRDCFGLELPERVARNLVCVRCRAPLVPRPGGRWCCWGGHTGLIGTRLLRLRLFDRGEGMPFEDEKRAKAELMRLARRFSRKHGITSSKIFQAMRRKAVERESGSQ